jgi:hypothetical protein
MLYAECRVKINKPGLLLEVGKLDCSYADLSSESECVEQPVRTPSEPPEYRRTRRPVAPAALYHWLYFVRLNGTKEARCEETLFGHPPV